MTNKNKMVRNKITIVGAGMVGAQAAYWAALKELGNIVLIDVEEGIPEGKALDLLQAGPIAKFDANIIGGTDYELTKNSDIIIITAGIPRKPGMTRQDLISTNAKIVKDVITKAKKHSPNAKYVMVTNPLDAMTYLAKQLLKLPREKVMGQAGVLDSGRMSAFVAQALGVSKKDVHSTVLGSHGEAMVPLPRYTTVSGIPITELLPKNKIDAIVKRTIKGGAEIVNLLKKGSAFYAPGAAVIAMAESILRDQKRVLPCSAFLQGEYGVKNVYAGVPAVLGSKGLERVIELELNSSEKKQFSSAVEKLKAVQKTVDVFLRGK